MISSLAPDQTGCLHVFTQHTGGVVVKAVSDAHGKAKETLNADPLQDREPRGSDGLLQPQDPPYGCTYPTASSVHAKNSDFGVSFGGSHIPADGVKDCFVLF